MKSSLYSVRRYLSCIFLISLNTALFAAPHIAHWQTAAGMRVFFVASDALPILDLQMDFAAGSAYDPPNKAGVAALTQSLLDGGAKGLDETAIANRLADLGAQLSGGVDKDRASLSLRTLVAPEQRVPALQLVRTILATPSYPNNVFEREKARNIAALQELLTKPAVLASRALWPAMYGTHPYAQSTTAASLKAITRQDLVDFYQRHYTTKRASLTLIGAISRTEAEVIAESLSTALPHSTLPVPAIAAVSAQTRSQDAPPEQILPHPAAQAHIVLGMPCIQRGDADFFPLVVGNYSLGGGGFQSRLMHEVRDKRGLAYGVSSSFSPMVEAGPFLISLQTKKTQAKEALAVVREVLANFLAEGPTQSELDAAKQNLIGSFPLRLDGNRKILDYVALIGFYGLPLDYLDRYRDNINNVSLADIRAAFARHVALARLRTVVVGGE